MRISELIGEEEANRLRGEFGNLVDLFEIRVRELNDFGTEERKDIELGITFTLRIVCETETWQKFKKKYILHALHSVEKRMLEVLSTRKL